MFPLREIFDENIFLVDRFFYLSALKNQIKCEGNCWKFSMYLLIECVGQTRKYLALYHDAQTSPHQVLIS